MYRRKWIVFKVIEALIDSGKSNITFPSPNPKYDQEHIGRMFRRKGEDIGIHRDENSLTFIKGKSR